MGRQLPISTPPSPDGTLLQLSARDPRPAGRVHDRISNWKRLQSRNHRIGGRDCQATRKNGSNVERCDVSFYNEALQQTYARIFEVQLALRFQRAEEDFGAKLAADEVEPMVRSAIDGGKKIDAVTHAADVATIRYAGGEIAARLPQFDGLCPVFPRPAFPLGEYNSLYEVDRDARRDSSRSAFGPFLVPASVSGLPAISLPTHLSQDKASHRHPAGSPLRGGSRRPIP